MSEQRIPKIIHYCWFGGNPLPDLAQKCIASWKKFCPDYRIKEWNESNYDVRNIPYISQAYDAKKYAFVSDYARLDIIYEHGGIYLDTDVELVKPLDNLLNLNGFMGFENGKLCNTGLGFGATSKLPIIKELRDIYTSLYFIKEDGNFNQTPCPYYQTDLLLKKGLLQNDSKQTIEGLTIFPKEYFCPKNYLGETNLTKDTYSIHHFDASWQDINEASGVTLIRRNYLNDWDITFNSEEEKIYGDILKSIFDIKTSHELSVAVNIMEKIFSKGKEIINNDNLYHTIRFFIFKISESGIQNKVTSLKLYCTTFRKWKIFETPRANLRYIYHCLRNLFHV